MMQPRLDMPVHMYFYDLRQAPEERNPRRVARAVRAHIQTTLNRQLCNRLPCGLQARHIRSPMHISSVQSCDSLGILCQAPRRLAGEPCGLAMDRAGHHAYLCARHLTRARHDAIQDHLAQYFRRRNAGLYCVTEQRTAQAIKTEEAPDDNATARKRPRRTADINVFECGGGDMAAKCAEYGLGPPPSPEPIHGSSPLVFEIAGAVSKSCIGFCRTMIWQQATKSTPQHAYDKGSAWRRAAHALWAPIAVILLKSRRQAEQACI